MIAAGVIGWPVAHSKSPVIHRFWLAKLGIDGDYGRFAVAPERLGDAIGALPVLGLRGVNVTVPHKVAVMAHLDRLDPLAAAVGAVNTVVVAGSERTGHNTDVEGFIAPVRAALGAAAGRAHLDLIGAGGAARAATHGWRATGASLTIFSRNEAKAARLAADFAGGASAALTALADGDAPPRAGPIVVVNATTLGMAGQPPLTIDLDRYPRDTIVYDLVYAPVETPLLAAARGRGLRTIDGLAMLIGQAATAFELFFGAPAPREHDAELRALLTGTRP